MLRRIDVYECDLCGKITEKKSGSYPIAWVHIRIAADQIAPFIELDVCSFCQHKPIDLLASRGIG